MVMKWTSVGDVELHYVVKCGILAVVEVLDDR